MHIESTLPIIMQVESAAPVFQRAEKAPEPLIEKQPVDQVISNLAHAVKPFDIALKFSKDSETGAIVIEMISQETGETLQQIPNEAMLNVAAALGKLQGQIFNRKA
jgi:uncharacterized FlaG/YvyC family protein